MYPNILRCTRKGGTKMKKCSVCEWEFDDDSDMGEYHIKGKGKRLICRSCEKMIAQSVVNSY